MKANEFQCLHFDYGLPVLPRDQVQPLYGAVARYKEPDAPTSLADTRIVHLSALRRGTNHLGPGEMRKRLREYVAACGGGWHKPEPANAGRISVFLRFLDAIFAQRRFAELIESDSANFLCDAFKDTSSMTQDLEQELSLMADFGMDLSSDEERVRLQPGDMLLFDNVSTVHGRVGPRQPRELWQMLFGLPNLSPTAIDRTVGVACNLSRRQLDRQSAPLEE